MALYNRSPPAPIDQKNGIILSIYLRSRLQPTFQRNLCYRFGYRSEDSSTQRNNRNK